jgi:hypothetical protein
MHVSSASCSVKLAAKVTLATFHTDMYELRKNFHIPEDFDVLQMLYALGADLARELERIDNLWEANVELEWDRQPIPVEEVTTPLEHTEGIDCVVCTDTMTPPGLQTPCGHKYCKDCLQSWIHACRPTSHLCPYCRQILFAKPKYRPKEPEVAMNYELERANYEEHLREVIWIHESCEWFEAELALQQTFESETAALDVQ